MKEKEKPKARKRPHSESPKPNEGQDNESKKETEQKPKAPAFLLPTASGRTPKVTSRYEEKPAEKAPTRASSTTTSKGPEETTKRSTSLTFEKSADALEKDLKLIPAKKIKSAESVNGNANPAKNGKDAEDSESDEEKEEMRLIEWIPPDSWSYLQKVFVTDVTIDNMTVTMRESKSPEGFFSQRAVSSM